MPSTPPPPNKVSSPDVGQHQPQGPDYPAYPPYPPPMGLDPSAFPPPGQGVMPGPGYAVYPGENGFVSPGSPMLAPMPYSPETGAPYLSPLPGQIGFAPPGSPTLAPMPYGPVPGGLVSPGSPTLTPMPYGPVPGAANLSSHPGQNAAPPYNPPSITGSNANDSADFAASAFSDKDIRRHFVAKVYAILTLQLTVAVGFILFCLFYPPVRPWIRKHSWTYYISYGLFLVTYWTLGCCESVRRRYPGNLIALSVFTLAMSYMAGVVSSFHKVHFILFCLLITAGVTLCVTLIAVACPIDITKCQFLLAVMSVVFLIFGIVCIVVLMCGKYTRMLHAVYGGMGAVLFSLYLAYDTQLIIGGRRYELSPEDYIVGAMDLFVDIMEIFFSLLALLNENE